MDLKEEIKAIEVQLEKHKDVIKLIDGLKKKKATLKKKLESIETAKLPFEKQFSKWLDKPSNDDEDWIPSRDVYPNLRELMDDHHSWNRYETYDVKSDYPFIEWWTIITEDNGKEIAEAEEWDYDVVVNAAKEVMKNNLGEFKFDW